MPKFLFNQKTTKKKLKQFFQKQRPKLNSFGSTVNQTFEAFVFAKTITYYESNGWTIDIINPIIKKKAVFKLKFSTRGEPNKYSYAVCTKDNIKCQIRHGLRISTFSQNLTNFPPANIVCDIAIINDIDLKTYKTDNAVPNSDLISFGEVKHMSAFAELIASFIGLVFELQHSRLNQIRSAKWKRNQHIEPFLYVSGILYTTAQGIKNTIEKRLFDIDIYSVNDPMI